MKETDSLKNELGYEVSLSEMKHLLNETNQGLEEVKKAVRSIFSAASLVIALIGVLQISSVQVIPDYQALYNGVIVTIMISYALLIVGSVFTLLPFRASSPTPPDWNRLKTSFFNQQDNQKIYELLISNYIRSIDRNAKLVGMRVKLAWVVGALLSLIILLLLYLSTLPRIPCQ